jgi:hypothetical protein
MNIISCGLCCTDICAHTTPGSCRTQNPLGVYVFTLLSPLILLCISLNYYHSIIVIFPLDFNSFSTTSSTPLYCLFKFCCTDLSFNLHLILNGKIYILRYKWQDTKRISEEIVNTNSFIYLQLTFQNCRTMTLNIKGKLEIRHQIKVILHNDHTNYNFYYS